MDNNNIFSTGYKLIGDFEFIYYVSQHKNNLSKSNVDATGLGNIFTYGTSCFINSNWCNL